MLSRIVGPFEVREKFKWMARATFLAEDLREDLSFLKAMRRFLLPLPLFDQQPPLRTDVFPPVRKFAVSALAGKKIGVVATGGSGAMVSAIGVMRACEEAGLQIAAISACSGSALALAPIAAGLDAQQTVEFLLGGNGDYLEVDWSHFRKLVFDLGRGFTGLVDAIGVESLFEQRLGDRAVGELPIPFYANVWDIDHNQLYYFGTRTRPEMKLARLVRAAVSLAGFVRPVEVDGALCSDGGVVNIFPVDPLVDHHPEIDFYIGINCFYPEGFDGEDLTGWQDQSWSILRAGTQAFTCQHIESARMQLRRIQDRCLLLHPLSHTEVKGVKLYELMLDRSKWPTFIEKGYQHARRALAAMSLEEQAR